MLSYLTYLIVLTGSTVLLSDTSLGPAGDSEAGNVVNLLDFIERRTIRVIRQCSQRDSRSDAREVSPLRGTGRFISVLILARQLWARWVQSTSLNPISLRAILISTIYTWLSQVASSLHNFQQVVCATCPSHLILVDLIILIICGKEKSLSGCDWGSEILVAGRCSETAVTTHKTRECHNQKNTVHSPALPYTAALLLPVSWVQMFFSPRVLPAVWATKLLNIAEARACAPIGNITSQSTSARRRFILTVERCRIGFQSNSKERESI
jgi:hypothetical protein